MSNKETAKSETIETNIVILGGGGAGLAAAVAAAELGSSVVLLEKHNQVGGNSAAALEIFACESPVQKRMGIDASRDEYFQIAMRFAHWSLNSRIIRAFVNKSGDTIRWLEEKGLTFELHSTRKFHLFGRELPPLGHNPVGADGAGIIDALLREAERLGVTLLKKTGAKKLLVDEEGRVIGVLASKKGGGELKVKADCVIIATGGYGGNKKMMQKYCPYYNENISLNGFPNMGDGIMMAMDIGAATEGLGILHIESKGLPREPKQLWLTSWRPETIWLNKRGERFTDESIDNVFEGANPVLRQPEKISFTVFDESIKQHIIKVLDEVVMPHYYGRGREKGNLRWLPPPEQIAPEDLDTLLRLAVDKGDVMISESWNEIADWIGARPEILKEAIEEYNVFCDKGHDDLFAKESKYLMPLRTPPFYAMRCGTRILGTIGGLKINHRMEVLDQNDDPIPGLYAGGIDTGGWESETYNQFLCGTTFGFAINSGRIAGENTVKYLQNRNN